MTARPVRRHARKASATTAEEIMLPAELMAGLTSSLPARPRLGSGIGSSLLQPLAESPTDGHHPQPSSSSPLLPPPTEEHADIPDLSRLDLAPLFPDADTTSTGNIEPRKASEDVRISEDTNQSSNSYLPTPSHSGPDKGILKASKKDEHGPSRWSLWPGAKKWFGASVATPSSLDLSPTHPTFDLGAGIPACRMSADDSALLSRTAPSLDFERSTSFVPPLSQERIKSTEFWSNFALELDPSKLKRIRFSMPLIVTEFDPETSNAYDSPADAVIWDTPRDPADPTSISSDLPMHGNDRYPVAGSSTAEELGENDDGDEDDNRDDDNNDCTNNCNTDGGMTSSSP
ncbi:hypothetical protein GGI21_001650, partial [Coemansia aciculifera]